jgi:uncharacterized membrane protein YjfL (UPF0719 family)
MAWLHGVFSRLFLNNGLGIYILPSNTILGDAAMTQKVVLITGCVELVLSFILGIGVAYVSFRTFARMTRDIDEMKEIRNNNAAAGILLACMMISAAIVIRQAIYPIISTLQTKLFAGLSATALLAFAGLSILYLLLATVFAILAIATGTRIFMRLTREIDELAEISRNNVAVAVTLGSVIIVMGLFLSLGVLSLLSAIIPEPALETIHTLGGGA